LLLLLLGLVQPVSAQFNWIEWKTSEGGNGHWYAFTPLSSWSSAETTAVQQGAHLASITSKEEDDFVRWAVCHGDRAWIGLGPGSTNWTDGSPVGYSPGITQPPMASSKVYINGSSNSIHWVADTGMFSIRNGVIELPAAPEALHPSFLQTGVTWYQWPTNFGGNGHWYGLCEAYQTNAGAVNMVAALGVELASFADTNETTFASQIVAFRRTQSVFRTGLSALPGEPFKWPDGSIVGDEVPAAKGRTNNASSFVRYCLGSFYGLGPITDQGGQIGSLLETATHPTNLPPAFTQYPSDQEYLEGTQTELWTFALGAEPMHYQWKIGGVELPGETNRSLKFLISTVSTGAFSVVASNVNGIVESKPATISVLPVVDVGSFQWIQRPLAIGGNDHWYASMPVPSGLTWSNAFDLSARLGGHLPTFVTQQEARRFATPWPLGAAGDFWLGLTDVEVEGEFRWINGESLTESAWDGNAPNQPNNAEPNFDYVFASQMGNQIPFSWRVFTNEFKLTWLVVERDTDPSSMPASIVDISQPITMRVGASNQLQVTAAGAGGLHFQWRFDGEPIPNATNATLTIESAALAQSGAYSVIVSNTFGASTNAPVFATIFVPQEPKLSFEMAQRFESGLLKLRFEHDFPDDTETLTFESSINLVNWTYMLTRFRGDPTTIDYWIDPVSGGPQFYIRARRWPPVSGD
jgi:hypothetical protein